MTRLVSIASLTGLALLVAGCCEPLPPRKPTTPEPTPAPIEAAPAAEASASEIPVVLLPSPASSSVSFRFVFKAGSADDPVDLPGLTLLTATLMTDGGTESLTYPELIEKLFPMAASVQVEVDRDETVFLGRCHKDHVAAYYELFRDVLTKPRLDPKDFERVRETLRSDLALSLRGNDDEALGKAALASVLYEGHPYGHPTLGSETGLGTATLDDVKAQRGRVLCASRLTIGLAGAIPEGFADKVRQDMKALPCTCAPPADLPPAPVPSGIEVLLVDKPSAEATAISIGEPIDVRRGDPDYPALKLVEAYFGQHRNSSGVLYTSLREKRGFNYGDYAYVEHFAQEGGERIPTPNISRRQQSFSIWLRPVADKDKHFALRLALAKLQELVDKGLTKEDFERTRAFVKRYYLTYAMTESSQLGYALDDRFYGLDKPYFEYLFGALDKLDVEQVNAAIKRHLSKDKMKIAMVTRDAAKFADALVADAPSPVTYASPKPDDVVAEDKIVEGMKLGIPRSSITIVKVGDVFR
ncbi:MAG: pitrilysin family protein [Deltaproteobacteria bacterium]|nr:pitrilysin family protein [Deltaproteobacteria bacterium]